MAISNHYGSLPLMGYFPVMTDGGGGHAVLDQTTISVQMKAYELAQRVGGGGQPPVIAGPGGLPYQPPVGSANLTDAYVQALAMARCDILMIYFSPPCSAILRSNPACCILAYYYC